MAALRGRGLANLDRAATARGFKTLDLMIVIAVTVTCLNFGWPVLSDLAVRSRVADGLAVADAAKSAVTISCSGAAPAVLLSAHSMGYQFGGSSHVSKVTLAGSCGAPLITVFTTGTGAQIDPVLRLVGETGGLVSRGHWSWTCVSDAPPTQLPDTCRY